MVYTLVYFPKPIDREQWYPKGMTLEVRQYENGERIRENHFCLWPTSADDQLDAWGKLLEWLCDFLDLEEDNVLLFPDGLRRGLFFQAKDKCKIHMGLAGSGILSDVNGVKLTPESPDLCEKVLLPYLSKGEGVPFFVSLSKKYEKRVTAPMIYTWAALPPLRDPRMQYIGKMGTWEYHSKDCPLIADTPPNLQIGFARTPKKGKFHPCPYCIGGAEAQNAVSPHVKRKRTGMSTELRGFLSGYRIRTSGEVIAQAIRVFCDQLGMCAEIKGGTVLITTISGEWFFAYNDRPITLHHKNADQRTYLDGTPCPQRYHVQKKEFYSPAHAICYIAGHDKPVNILEREMERLREEGFLENNRARPDGEKQSVAEQPREELNRA